MAFAKRTYFYRPACSKEVLRTGRQVMRLNKNIKIFLNYFFGPLLFLWLSYSIYNQVKHQPDLKTSWIKIKQSLQSTEIWDLAIVIFLMIINWSIEALKWKISIQKVQPVSFSRSFRA